MNMSCVSYASPQSSLFYLVGHVSVDPPCTQLQIQVTTFFILFILNWLSVGGQKVIMIKPLHFGVKFVGTPCVHQQQQQSNERTKPRQLRAEASQQAAQEEHKVVTTTIASNAGGRAVVSAVQTSVEAIPDALLATQYQWHFRPGFCDIFPFCKEPPSYFLRFFEIIFEFFKNYHKKVHENNQYQEFF